jgi:hypothetical protein
VGNVCLCFLVGGLYLEVELLGLMVSLSNFLRNVQCRLLLSGCLGG